MKTVPALKTVSAIAEDQWGLFTSTQAHIKDLSNLDILRLTEKGLIKKIRHGVYLINGVNETPITRLRAAWIALDPSKMGWERIHDKSNVAVVSHVSAAFMHGIGDFPYSKHEFTCATRKQSRKKDLRIHLSKIKENEITIIDGLPVTSIDRTFSDLSKDGWEKTYIENAFQDIYEIKLGDAKRLLNHPELKNLKKSLGIL